jgi:hypothetical protein
MEEHLTKLVKPFIISGWNFNNDERCVDANESFAHFPKASKKETPPRVRFELIFWNGRTQDRLNCSKPFVEMVDCITEQLYLKALSANI